VRGTGGNNAKRFLFAPAYLGYAGYSLPHYIPPADPANRTAANFSYYYANIDLSPDQFGAIKTYLIDKAVRAVFTEFGSYDGEHNERVKFTRESVAQAKALGIPLMYWEYTFEAQSYNEWWDIHFGGVEEPFELFPPEIMGIVMGR